LRLRVTILMLTGSSERRAIFITGCANLK